MATKGYNLEQTGEQVQAALNKVISLGPATEEADGLMSSADKASLEHLNSVIDTKVDKVTGKGLSTNDFTNEDKNKLNTAYQAPSTGIPATDMSSEVQSSLGKANTALQSADLVPITEKIPAQASAQNQLADKAFVNSSIATATAEFKGTYDTLEELQAVTADKNDYGYVVSTDEAGNTVYSRYKYNGSSWAFEYDLNNSSFTAAEWASIQSQITAALVQKLSALPTNQELGQSLSGKQDIIPDLSSIRSGANAGATAYQKPGTGIPASDLASGVIPTVPTISTNISTDAASDAKTASPKAVKTYVDGVASEIGEDIEGINGDIEDLGIAIETIGNGAYEEAWDGDSTPVVADIPAGVVVTYSSASYTGTLAASASTVDKIYLVSDGNGNYDRYVTIENSGTYSWKKVGTTAIPLSDYTTKAEFSQLEHEVDGIPGGEETTQYSESGYIKLSDGSIVTGNSWIHTPLIPVTNVVEFGKIVGHGSVAAVAFYSTQELSSYISGIIGGEGEGNIPQNRMVLMSEVTIPEGANYVAFSTNGNNYAGITVGTVQLTGGLKGRVSTLESTVSTIEEQIDDAVLVTAQTLTDAKKEQARENIDAASAREVDEALNGTTTQISTDYNDAGYIKLSDGSIVTGNTWIHTPLIPVGTVKEFGKIEGHGSVAAVAFYGTTELSSYISGAYGGTAPGNCPVGRMVLMSEITIPEGANYVAFSTNGNTYSVLTVKTEISTPGLNDKVADLEERVEDLEEVEDASVRYTAQTLTEGQKAQARANIGIANTNKYVHFSLDDCTFWADLIDNENNYDSCFGNSVLAKLKQFHDAYGLCFTLNCFIVSGQVSIADVPNKWASEFAENKDWLRFAFHGTTTSETFSSTDAAVLKGYYDTFVAAIFKMTGTYDCIDRVTRLSSYSGRVDTNIPAIRDTDCGIVGLLTNDRDVNLSVGTSYGLTTAKNEYLHTHDKMYDADSLLWFIRTEFRLESSSILPSVLNTAKYANFRPVVEIFWHETTGWASDYAFTTWLKPAFDWLAENGYKNVFTSDLLVI